MERGGKRVLVCDCERTMTLDGKALAEACGGGDAVVHHQLCRAEIEAFTDRAGEGRPLLVACTQEAPLFLETLDAMEAAPEAAFVNVRERAGWSAEGARATPKIAALIAEAALDLEAATSVVMTSAGTLLVLGRDEVAIDAAKQVAGRLDATVVLEFPADVPPPAVMDVPVFAGRVVSATGRFGAFEVRIEGFAAARPSSRAALAFEDERKGGSSTCDLILDLRGGTPLFPAPEKRDGYFHPDPGNPAAVQRALFDLVDMVGTFDKPRYVDFDAGLCAHSRSQITGCTRCLDVCPAGAIEPAGEAVAIDPYLCAGCGSCAGVCPTGAARYALPAGDGVFRRLATLAHTYLDAGGTDPVLFVHDVGFGAQVIDIVARAGRGLPAAVIPFAVNQTTQLGLDHLLAAVAFGIGRVVLLVPAHKADEAAGLREQVGLAEAVLDGLGYGSGRITVLEAADPAAVEDALWSLERLAPVPRGDFAALGRKREPLNLALYQLRKAAPTPVDAIALPAGAPFGAVVVDVPGCTVCLACVGACPTGALKDNPETPMLRFREDACVQCGLCQATCPEKVIALEPRLGFAEDARAYVVVKADEPFACVRCGKEYGSKASIEKLSERLAGHSMFAGEGRIELIKMCEDCRVVAQLEHTDHPFAGPPRPPTRTTDDYLAERDELRRLAAEDIARREAEDEGES